MRVAGEERKKERKNSQMNEGKKKKRNDTAVLIVICEFVRALQPRTPFARAHTHTHSDTMHKNILKQNCAHSDLISTHLLLHRIFILFYFKRFFFLHLTL